MKKEEERTKAINKNITSIQDWFQLVQFPPDAGQLTTTRRKLTGEKKDGIDCRFGEAKAGTLGLPGLSSDSFLVHSSQQEKLILSGLPLLLEHEGSSYLPYGLQIC